MIEVNDVSMCFNMAKEKSESLKEYFVALCTGHCSTCVALPIRAMMT